MRKNMSELLNKYNIFFHLNMKKIFNDKYIDYRLPENRVKGFIKSTYTRMAVGDFDHVTAGLIADMKGYTRDQRAWFSVLYGFSENIIFSYIILETFPDITNTDTLAIFKWLNKEKLSGNRNVEDIVYKNSNRGFVSFVNNKTVSIITQLKNMISKSGHNDLYTFFEHVINVDGAEYFNDKILLKIKYLNQDINTELTIYMLYKLLKFKRLDILNLESPYNKYSNQGLAYLLDKKEVLNKINYNTDDLNELMPFFHRLYDNMSITLGGKLIKVDSFILKNSLTLYKDTFMGKTFNPYDTKFILNYFNCHLVNYLEHALGKWQNIDWSPLVASCVIRGDTCMANYKKKYTEISKKYGVILGLYYLYPNEPNLFETTNLLSPRDLRSKILDNYWDNVTDKDCYKGFNYQHYI